MPRRKGKAPAAEGSSKATATKARPSKLAKDNNITAEEENEIREAFSLFSEPLAGEKEGVLPIDDLRSAMIALGIPPRNRAELDDYIGVLDPEREGFTTFEPFLMICALKLHTRDDDADVHRQELDEAFRLFTATGATGVPGGNSTAASQGGSSTHITMTHLKRIATVLNEDVPDDVLRDMILEANGGIGVARGVDKNQFDQVMMSAGVWKGHA